jgi:branched-chain amino acid transport system ATP-binding protein
MSTVLSIRGLIAGYGWGDILHGVDLDVEVGSITCIIGPNGAGKSTLLKTISGLLAARSGDIVFEGRSIVGCTPTSVLSLGIGHVPQDRSLFPLMSVWDNLLMGGYILKDQALVRRRADEVAELFPIVKERRHERAGALSGGQQKAVEIARSLMLQPKVVLMDELSMGLDPKSRHLAFDTVVRLNSAGRTVLMVEQNARAGLAIADHGAVMEAGTVKLEGSGKSLLDDREVARLYLGKIDQLAVNGGTTA